MGYSQGSTDDMIIDTQAPPHLDVPAVPVPQDFQADIPAVPEPQDFHTNVDLPSVLMSQTQNRLVDITFEGLENYIDNKKK